MNNLIRSRANQKQVNPIPTMPVQMRDFSHFSPLAYNWFRSLLQWCIQRAEMQIVLVKAIDQTRSKIAKPVWNQLRYTRTIRNEC